MLSSQKRKIRYEEIDSKSFYSLHEVVNVIAAQRFITARSDLENWDHNQEMEPLQGDSSRGDGVTMSKFESVRRLDAVGVLLAVGAVILIGILVKFFSKSKKRLPGPFFHMPVLGNLSLVGPLPHQSFYHLSKKYGDIFSLKLGLSYTVVISSPELAREVLRDQDLTFASRPPNVAAEILMYGTKDIAWAPYSDHWRHMRKVCVLELFTVKRIESFKNVRAEEVQDLVHRVYETCKVRTNLHPKPIHFDFRRCHPT